LILHSQKISTDIPKTSYVGTFELGQVFPGFLTQILREGFGNGKLLFEAILHAQSRGLFSRSYPSPINEHLQIKGLYPCGEGAGCRRHFIDGEKCAIMIAESLHKNLDLILLNRG
jgi:uncharacterized FAD-dependent dehydrogenase